MLDAAAIDNSSIAACDDGCRNAADN